MYVLSLSLLCLRKKVGVEVVTAMTDGLWRLLQEIAPGKVIDKSSQSRIGAAPTYFKG